MTIYFLTFHNHAETVNVFGKGDIYNQYLGFKIYHDNYEYNKRYEI